MSERIIEIRSLCIEPEYVIDYSDYERRIRMIEERGREIELRYNHNHDEKRTVLLRCRRRSCACKEC